MNALQIIPPFREYYLIDLNRERVEALSTKRQKKAGSERPAAGFLSRREEILLFCQSQLASGHMCFIGANNAGAQAAEINS